MRIMLEEMLAVGRKRTFFFIKNKKGRLVNKSKLLSDEFAVPVVTTRMEICHTNIVKYITIYQEHLNSELIVHIIYIRGS